MPLSGLRILVVEDEYLIAIDAEHLLRGAGAADVVISTRANYSETLASRKFDAVLIDTGPDTSHVDEDIALVTSTGARVAFTTSDIGLVAGLAGHDGVRFIAKPFDSRHINALVEALRGNHGGGEGS
jgi:AmiR/NasT family two-component response regulator